MTNNTSSSIKDTLNRSQARQLDYCALNQDFALARWSNQHDHVSYQMTEHHTLSYYLAGGYSTQRLDDISAGRGSPGKLCLMPGMADSEWQIGESQEFIHLYFSDAALKLFALESFDLDSRLVNLPELTFADHRLLSSALDAISHLNWHETGERLHLQQMFYQMMGCLLQQFVSTRSISGYPKGGLARKKLKSVMEYVHDHLEGDVDLASLAEISGVSRFHFARMFKQSTGLSPHQYVTKVRVRKSLEMLLSGKSQVEVATVCGYSHQSHFVAQFKREYGITPARLIREIGGFPSGETGNSHLLRCHP